MHEPTRMYRHLFVQANQLTKEQRSLLLPRCNGVSHSPWTIALEFSEGYLHVVNGELQKDGFITGPEILLKQPLIETWLTTVILQLPPETALHMMSSKATELGIILYDCTGEVVDILNWT